MSFTIVSLFDGSGGFPLAASMCGIEPVGASEVEPYPIAVTRSRFPNMKHLGSVTDVRGDEVEPVDVITFGSPCQDLSVAGKRAGLKHTENGDEETTRSGLFMEAVRIIKEMRKATNGLYPRFAVWENVPGAFSSNKGEDFRIVLEEFIKVCEPSAVMPAVPQSGWPYADSYCGDGWSIAYRVFDAQFWGVPQRRRRIYLVADFRGQCAGKILFEREGLRGYFAESGAAWQGSAGDAESGVGTADCTGECVGFDAYNMAVTGDVSKALNAAASDADPVPCVMTPVGVLASSAVNAEVTDGTISPCLMARAGTGGNQLPLVAVKSWDARGNGDGDTVNTITGDHENRITDYTSVVVEPTAFAMQGFGDYKGGKLICEGPIALDQAFFNQGQNALYDPQLYEDGTNPTLVARGPNAVCTSKVFPTHEEVHEFIADNNADAPHQQDLLQAADDVARTIACGTHAAGSHLTKTVINYGTHYIVRRLTPTECARLQGFPDNWGHPDIKTELTDEEYRFWLGVRNTHATINGKTTKEYTKEQILKWYNGLHTDSSEYKMWGNGIALPCALYVMQGISDALENRETGES